MKTCPFPVLAFVLLFGPPFFSSSPLFSQSRNDVSVFIAPVTGGTLEQRAFFAENFRSELIGAHYAVADSRESGDYAMFLRISRDGGGEGGAAAGPANLLNLSLVDNEDGGEIVQFSWAFAALEDMYQWNLHLIYQAMANVPLTKIAAAPEDDYWRNKWIYAAGYGGVDPTFGFYDSGNDAAYQNRDYTFYFAPLFGLGMEFQFLGFMSTELGVMASPYAIDAEHNAVVFGLPLLLKFPLKPSRHFMLEPYAGFQFNTSSQSSIIPPLFSWVGGFQYAIKAGERSAVILELRAVGDIGATKLSPPAKAPSSNPHPKTYDRTDRFQLQFMIGFKAGFYNR
ncbi:MAG: hypothetical protein LBH51_04430 [Treponema sp.]|jgi:hypothetical protein|nr:hypothetical protein [Treponema sp.]